MGWGEGGWEHNAEEESGKFKNLGPLRCHFLCTGVICDHFVRNYSMRLVVKSSDKSGLWPSVIRTHP